MAERKDTPFTGEHFAAWCEKMVGQPYWYGSCVYKCTQNLLDRKAKQRMNRAQHPADAARQQQRADRKHNRQRQPAQPFAPWRFRQALAQSPFQRADGFTHDDHGMRQPSRVAKNPIEREAAEHRVQDVHAFSSI